MVRAWGAVAAPWSSLSSFVVRVSSVHHMLASAPWHPPKWSTCTRLWWGTGEVMNKHSRGDAYPVVPAASGAVPTLEHSIGGHCEEPISWFAMFDSTGNVETGEA